MRRVWLEHGAALGTAMLLSAAACSPSWRLNREVNKLFDAERYAEAKPAVRHAPAHDEQPKGPRAQDVAIALGNLAYTLKYLGRHAEAEPLFLYAASSSSKQHQGQRPPCRDGAQ